MRSPVVALLALIGLVTAFPTAAAPLSGRISAIVAAAPAVVPIAQKCPQGQRWVPAGYAKHGKYRPGHCVPS